MNRFVLRVPDELYEKIRAQAQQQGVSINQYLLYTLTRTVSAAETGAFFAARAAQANPEQALALLDRVADRAPERAEDAMPARPTRMPARRSRRAVGIAR